MACFLFYPRLMTWELVIKILKTYCDSVPTNAKCYLILFIFLMNKIFINIDNYYMKRGKKKKKYSPENHVFSWQF